MYIRPKFTVHKYAETIQGKKLFKGGNYMRKYGMCFLIRGKIKNIFVPYLRLVWVEVLMPHLLDSAAALFDRMGRIREV